MTRAQRAHVIANAVQVVSEWRNLRPWVVQILFAGGMPVGHVSTEIESFDGVDDWRLGFIPEYAVLGRESLQLDKQHGR